MSDGQSSVASGDLPSNQSRLVRMSGAASFEVSAITNGNGQKPFGIQQNDPANAGEPVEVALPGTVAKAELGGTVNEGDELGSNAASGELIAAPVEAAMGTADLYINALALEAGADGDIIKVLVLTPVKGSTE